MTDEEIDENWWKSTRTQRTTPMSEEDCLKLIEDYFSDNSSPYNKLYVSEDAAAAAARQLGKLRSQKAIELLIKCIIVGTMYDTQSAFRNALVAIGRTALSPIIQALTDSRFRSVVIHPGGPARGLLLQAKERIESGHDSYIKDDNGIDIHDTPDSP